MSGPQTQGFFVDRMALYERLYAEGQFNRMREEMLQDVDRQPHAFQRNINRARYIIRSYRASDLIEWVRGATKRWLFLEAAHQKGKHVGGQREAQRGAR